MHSEQLKIEQFVQHNLKTFTGIMPGVGMCGTGVHQVVAWQVTPTSKEPVIQMSMLRWGAWRGAVAMMAWWGCLTPMARRCRAWASASALSDSSPLWRPRPGSVELASSFLLLLWVTFRAQELCEC